MKELSIEDKAKRYDEAIKRAKSKIKNDKNHVLYEDDIIEIFSELKEPEDERIRKDIIAIIHLYFGEPLDDEAKEMIAWLEKQREHANFRSKIQIGDKVTRNDSGVLVNLSQFERVIKKTEKQDKKVKPIKGFNSEFERQISQLIASIINKEYEYNEAFVKWTSDALLNYAKREIEKQGENKKPILEFNADDWYVSKVDGEIHNTYHSVDKVEPKFYKGEWVAINPKLRFATPLCIRDIDNNKYRVESVDGNSGTPKIDYLDNHYHLWTIADAKDGDILISSHTKPFIYNGKSTAIFVGGYCGISIMGDFVVGKEECNWTLNNYIKPATKEQRKLLFKEMKKAEYKWDAEKKELKKISQEYPLTPNECIKPADWTEDDEKMLLDIDDCIRHLPIFYETIKVNGEDKTTQKFVCDIRNWLKTIRDKVHSQNHWKPNDKQMKVLYKYAEQNNYDGNVLTTLYQDLEKLTEKQ